MIWLEKLLLVLLLLCWTVCHWWSASTWRFSSARVLADHHEVDRNMASSDTIGEQSERVGLDQEADPGGKPDDEDIDASAVKPKAVFQQEVARQQWLTWARGGAVTAPKTSLPRQHG